MAKLTESRPPALGQQHTYSITPPPAPGCRVTWFINGQAVTLRDKVGGLEPKGFGAAGTMTVEVFDDTAGTVVMARVECPEMEPFVAGPLVVGGGASPDPCQQEPCKTARQGYIDAVLVALEISKVVEVACILYKFVARLFFAILLLLIIVSGLLVVCLSQLLNPTFCVLLYVIGAALTTLLTGIGIYALVLRRELYNLQIDCLDAKIEVLKRRARMVLDCPLECIIERVEIDCGCK